MNVAKTLLMFGVFSALAGGLGYWLAGGDGALAGMGFGAALSAVAWWYSPAFLLHLHEARPLAWSEAPRVFATLKRLAHRAAIAPPTLYLIPDRVPNAFAVARNRDEGIVAITSGFLRLLNEEEMEAVLAHEIARIESGETMPAGLSAALGAALMSVANFATWGLLNGGPTRILRWVVGPFSGALARLGMRKQGVYAADAAAIAITGKPLALVSALGRMEQCRVRSGLLSGSAETGHLFIMNPRGDETRLGERVARLWEMARQRGLAA